MNMVASATVGGLCHADERPFRWAAIGEYMKKFCALLVLLVGSVANAGEYYRGYSIDEYDPATGLYFRGVEKTNREGGFLVSKRSRSEVVNISIFDPSTGESRLLFGEPAGGDIAVVLFETGFSDGKIEFGGTSPRSYVKNNVSVAKREPRTKVLVEVQPEDRKGTILFISEKRAGGLTRLATVPEGADWHLDMRNSKLRVVHQLGHGIRIESHEW